MLLGCRYFEVCMFDVRLNISIPFEVRNVEGNSMFDAAENCRKLITATLPLVIADNFERIRDEMTIAIDDIKVIENVRNDE